MSIDSLAAQISLPASKSISNRALILDALSYSPYDIENLADCDDTNVLVSALDSNSTTFDIGAAGTTMRFLTAFLSKTVGEWVITGSERMKQRPIKLLVDALNGLGARIEYLENDGYPPLKIVGSALVGGEIHLKGNVSSQYISALMMIAPCMLKGLKIVLEGKIISKPYINMTMQMMDEYGIDVDFLGNVIQIEPQEYQPIPYKVESDWSAASYWYEILSLVGKGGVFLKGLGENSYQGDSKVADLFEQLGVKTTYMEDGVLLSPNGELTTRMEYDFTDEPDLTQTFAVTCCLKGIPFKFSGLETLKIKETDRIAALINELAKLGYVVYEPAESQLAWDGARCEPASPISIATYHDHRMAMAFAPAALVTPIIVENPQVVTKSYPGFWDDFEKLSN
ncbi:MAG: 3-phosphoshikimate 1-carboxyvinyltransferase [Paludibacter sp.]|nr:3-phosphoshikimate 1-carboxyvinyltransferase [Paludibacter sp.]MBP7613142.1 3-phosphoshikimate 1-carboxyvinyltransferase [Paludibacter sp.]